MRSYNLEKEFCNVGNLGSGLKYNTNTNKFDVDVDFSILSEHLVEVTYDELLLLKYDSDLKPGVFYRITDYEFTSFDSEVKSAGHRFDIIVLALSEDTLSEDARAIQHKWTDLEKLVFSETELNYFNNLNLSAWKLKYSLEGTNKQFNWAELNSIVFSSLYEYNSYDNYAYQRCKGKDDITEGYYAYNLDDDVVYIKSEDGIYGEDIFIKDSTGAFVPRTPQKRGWGDSYLLETAYVDEDAGRTYFYVYDVYNTDHVVLGWDKQDSFYTDFYAFYIEATDPKEFIGKLVRQTYKRENYTGTLGDARTYSLQEKEYEYDVNGVKSTIKGLVIGSVIAIPADFVEIEPGKYKDPNGNTIYWYAGESYDYVKDTKSGIKNYKGIIYKMTDEFDNTCEYDFKNALITGKYSLFDPDEFFYTFVNSLVTSYLHLKIRKMDSSDNYITEPVILYPGTYSFLNNMPFRYYDFSTINGNSDIQFVELSIGDDLYALCVTNNSITLDGITIYPTEIWHDSSGTRALEDKQWYFKEPPTENVTTKVYYKDSSGKEYEVKLASNWIERIDYLYNKWVFDLDPRNVINLNYNKDTDNGDTIGNSFDISLLNSGITTNNIITYEEDGILYGSGLMIKDDTIVIWHRRGNDNEDLTYTFTNTFDSYWVSDAEDDKTKNISYEFTTPITIDKPMYLYINSKYYYNDIIDHNLDLYALVLCEDEKITEDSKIYNITRLEEKSAKDLLISQIDLSLESYCFENELKSPRDTYSLTKPLVIPKTICAGTYKTKIDCCYSFLLDCYLIVFEGGDMSKNTIKQSYGIDIINSKDIKISGSNLITIKQSYVLNLIQCCCSLILDGANCNLTSLSNTSVSHCKYTDVQYLKRSEVKNCSNSKFIIKNTSGNLDNLYNIDINSLNFKTVYLDEIIPSSRDNSLIQIRSEEDLTITV